MMNTINANTKIAAVIKQHPDAIEAIISINPKFEKLRNPLLRKLMAGRTSLAMAAKVGGCSIDDFFEKLKPLGFTIESSVVPVMEEQAPVPDFIHAIREEQLIELDVRPVIAAGKDPLSLILEKAKNIKPGQILKIVNTFAPVPLIPLLEKKGFISYMDTVEDKLVETYFFRQPGIAEDDILAEPKGIPDQDWDKIWHRYKEKLITVDVRNLEMPQPMITILDSLEQMADGNALFVHHKRIPVYLLPELSERGFEFRVKEISDGEVHLLIFKR
ncbi:DUF2249 domain-containing protein [Mucilaginibacter sp.]|jgi:uncharacterized protein (DUF2249 family)|uniref:DUF2249 domain-containing protein n=1 Tax=Mucilaginibacter sp. TaxID=1882438 RepID=UPI002C6A4637|nr:DUF2249 domain-containing protein [Mucilaginibacter sp.]HTI59006.1 DUF2249 domain-containing protein [Mucilaginibacter sp.]